MFAHQQAFNVLQTSFLLQGVEHLCPPLLLCLLRWGAFKSWTKLIVLGLGCIPNAEGGNRMRDIHHPASFLTLDLEEMPVFLGCRKNNIIIDSSYHTSLQHATKLCLTLTLHQQLFPLAKLTLSVMFQCIF